MENIATNVRQHIAKGELETAIDILLKAMPDSTEIILQSSFFHELKANESKQLLSKEENYNKQLLSKEEVEIRRNYIKVSILDFLTDHEEQQEDKKITKIVFRIILPVLLILIALVVQPILKRLF